MSGNEQVGVGNGDFELILKIWFGEILERAVGQFVAPFVDDCEYTYSYFAHRTCVGDRQQIIAHCLLVEYNNVGHFSRIFNDIANITIFCAFATRLHYLCIR